VARDWQKYPAIVSVSAPGDLYALGDVHGDYDRLTKLLVATGIIDAIPSSPTAAHWSAGKAVLVCTGDFIDKYNQSLSVIALLRTLQQQAPAAGGLVIVTLGNHEAEFLASKGIGARASDFSDELKHAGISPEDVASGRENGGLGAWLRNLPAGAKVGDWFFCHAGNTAGSSLAGLNKNIEEQITKQGWAAPILSDPNSMLEARMHPRPWWDWDGSEPELKDSAASSDHDDSRGQARLRQTVEALGAKHLVFGHQPGKIEFLDGSVRAAGQMYFKYNGLVFLIDTGMSRGVQNGRAALLKIQSTAGHESAKAIYIDGKSEPLWP
jgi:hypothetical protein